MKNSISSSTLNQQELDYKNEIIKEIKKQEPNMSLSIDVPNETIRNNLRQNRKAKDVAYTLLQ